MKDDPISICPDCEGSVKRLLYPVGIVFKGSGWYINDSRKPEAPEGGAPSQTDAKDSTGKPGDSKSETTSEPKSENKPAATSESNSAAKTEAKPAAATT